MASPAGEQRRAAALDAARAPFDVVVIGGGVNGVGVAWEAALRGLRVALLEQDDLGSGTSAWSSRLIHGGLKYLERLDVRLARESLREREWLLGAAPHLVRPLRMLLPFYTTAGHGRAILRAGMVAYDVLSFDKSLDRHAVESREKILRRAPALSPDGLQGGALYYDAQVEYAERLAVEAAVAAGSLGATILTKARVDEVLADGDRVTGVRWTDLETGDTAELQASVVVNVAGPWADAVLDPSRAPRLIGGTKGTHYFVDLIEGAPHTEALYYEAAKDGRPMMVIPWLGGHLIGATDVRYEGDPAQAHSDADELRYILDETNRVLPSANLRPEDIRFAYTGVRPLPHQPDGDVASITRRHLVHDHAPRLDGLLSVVGGKLTTFRALGQEVADVVLRRFGRRSKSPSRRLRLPGGCGYVRGRPAATLEVMGFEPATAERLERVYGARALGVAELARQDPALAETVDPATGVLAAEVVWALRTEFARSLTDIVWRRTMAGLHPSLGLDALEPMARVAAAEQGWSPERQEEEIAAARRYAERFTL